MYITISGCTCTDTHATMRRTTQKRERKRNRNCYKELEKVKNHRDTSIDKRPMNEAGAELKPNGAQAQKRPHQEFR